MSQPSPFGAPICDLPWDEAIAKDMIGKTIVVGFTYSGLDGEPPVLEQRFGTISAADALAGVQVDRGGGDRDFWLPPQLDAIFQAAPGWYRLQSTGEDVLDPDFLSNWTIELPRTELAQEAP